MFMNFNRNHIIDLLFKNIQIFQFFTRVYVFGSVVKNNITPNDVDLLLVYDKYSNEIQSEKDYICSFLEKIFDFHLDLTVLSEKELFQTKFLEKICIYERLK